eukprot:15448366-Alexandrium_andersonii.AAC.1
MQSALLSTRPTSNLRNKADLPSCSDPAKHAMKRSSSVVLWMCGTRCAVRASVAQRTLVDACLLRGACHRFAPVA